MTKKLLNWTSGIVSRGDGRGRQLGFPTANLVLENQNERPASGIYACWAKIDNQTHAAVLHAGERPTFKDAKPTIEVHLLNTSDKDLYDKKMSFQIIKKLREIIKFDTVQDLVNAIDQDCQQAKIVLSFTSSPLRI